MSILSRLSRLCLCLLVLFVLISCTREQEAQPVQKDIGWKQVAEKLNDLEKAKQKTLDALAKKEQARTPPKLSPERKQ